MVLKISLSNISSSIKFSAFIASGVLFAISLVQIIVGDTLFWEIIGIISGIVFVFLLSLVLIKVLRPLFKAIKARKKKKQVKRRSVFSVIGGMFKLNLYYKIMAIIWLVILLVALDFTVYYFGLIEDKVEKYKILANFGFMAITVSAALFIYNFGRVFRK